MSRKDAVIPAEALTANIERWDFNMLDSTAVNGTDADQRRVQRDLTHSSATISVDELESMRQKAHQEGLEQGLVQGLAQAKIEAQPTLDCLENIRLQLANPLKIIDAEIERELTELSILVARQVIRRELQHDRPQIAAVIREGLALLPVNNVVVNIHLHPLDADAIREIYPVNEGENERWKLIDDPSLTRGGCTIETVNSRIDATVENRINQLATKLLGDSRDRD